ncbi:MAG: copper-binding protein [Vicinamibacterales bacterium]
MRPALALLACALILTAACTRAPEARTYALQGQILAVKPETREVLVKHEDIPGFMPAMTMAYTVKDAALLKDRQPGDLISATLKVSSELAWLSAITKVGAAPLPDDAPDKIPVAAGVTPLKPGDAVPATSLLDQDLRQLSLANWKGSAVAVTFIYTRCPLPQYCPLLDRRFAEVQQAISGDPALRGHTRLLSVSFDPANDQAAVLSAHAKKLGADAAIWRFATAPEDVVDRFAATFGVNVIREKDGTITHNLRTAVIDPSGLVVALHDDNNWTAAQLVDELKRALGRQR